MRSLFAVLALSASLAAVGEQGALSAANVAGTWQANLPVTPQGIPMVVRITRSSADGWNATMFVENSNPIPIYSVTVHGSLVELDCNVGRYLGWISEDGTAIRGTWMHGNPRPLDPPMALELRRATPQTTWSLPPDPSSHTTRYVTVDKDTNLEVLDWGGTGRPVVLVTGLGSNAHVFDQFAPKLAANYHVYGITRRGFGLSSAPFTGYTADRLGDDVLTVFDALHLEKPILVGHSIGGEELSSIGSRFPQRVAGLVYLEAGYPYAYCTSEGDPGIDAAELRRKLDKIRFSNQTPDARAAVQQLVTELPRFTQALQRKLETMPVNEPAAQPSALAPEPQYSSSAQDVLAGVQRYTTIPVPILAIFAAPHEYLPSTGNDPAARAAADALDEATTAPLKQSAAFEKGLPTAHVVRLPHASHNVFSSNEADVLREMRAFIDSLPQ
jgi:pimeloyl-ACP methyl ester carboxylesterase